MLGYLLPSKIVIPQDGDIVLAIETDTEFSLILVPASGRDSEEIITDHHPGEPYVIIKWVLYGSKANMINHFFFALRRNLQSVQTRYPSLLPKVDGFSVGDPGKD